MAKEKKFDWDAVREVQLLKPTRVRALGSSVTKAYKVGDVVKVNGSILHQLLSGDDPQATINIDKSLIPKKG